MAGSGGSLLRLDVVRDEEAVEKEICFRKCRCGSQANPLWNYFVPPGGVGLAVRGAAAACWENSSATARIIRKINYFPSLLINFTIASMFLLLAGYYRSLSSDVQWKENSAWKRRRRNKDGTDEGKKRRKLSRLPWLACLLYPRFRMFPVWILKYPFFFLLSLNVTRSRDVAETWKSLFHVRTTWCFEDVSTNLNFLCCNYSPCLFCVISDFISSRLMLVKLQKHIILLKKHTKWCFKNEDKTFLNLSSYCNLFILLNNNTPRKLDKTFSKCPVRNEQFPSTRDEIQFRKQPNVLFFVLASFERRFRYSKSNWFASQIL